jgi:hypothetical protein
MAKGATAKDAQLILHLYDLRREAEMRKAREWYATEFWPDNADDFLQVAFAAGTQENRWLRQVQSYWGIAAAFVIEGALNEDLFLKPSFSGEMFMLFAKVYPFLGELREKLGDPRAFADIEAVITRSKWGRERLKFVLKRLESWKEKTTNKNKDASVSLVDQ